MNNIIPSFEKSLFSEGKELIKDIIEVGIDSILSEGLLKDIPIVNFFVSTKNIAQTLHDRNLLNQTLHFIQEFNKGNIDNEKYEEYKKELSTNSKKAEKELGRVLLILNRNIDVEKSKILANFYKNYINCVISWNDFCELSSALELLFISDINTLCDIYNDKLSEKDEVELYQIDRLIALGLVRKNIVVWQEAENDKYLVLTPFGDKLIKCKDY